MDEARIKSTGEPVTGEDLWYMDVVDHGDYECFDCGLAVIPCSYDKDVNLRRPYFKVHKGTRHEEGCRFADDAQALRDRAKDESIAGEDGFPLPFPSRLIFANLEKVVRDDQEQGGERAEPRQRRPAQGTGNRRRPHQYSTDSFRAVVKHYLDFPHDRDLPLAVPGIDGRTYRECFQPLWQPEGAQTFLKQVPEKIYYGPASWKEPEQEGDTLTILLTKGLWVKKKKKPDLVRPFYIQADMSAWPELSREAFIYEFRKTLHDVRGDKSKKMLVFFIGPQDLEEDFYRFFVNDYRLITMKVVNKGDY